MKLILVSTVLVWANWVQTLFHNRTRLDHLYLQGYILSASCTWTSQLREHLKLPLSTRGSFLIGLFFPPFLGFDFPFWSQGLCKRHLEFRGLITSSV